MVFSGYSPMGHVLPKYLSIALVTRLNKQNIETLTNHSLRWVGPSSRTFVDRHVADGCDSANTTGSLPELEPCCCSPAYSTTAADDLAKRVPEPTASAHRRRGLHVVTAHWSDHRDTAIHTTDRVVLAGADVAPLSLTIDIPGKGVAGRDNTAGPLARKKKAGTLRVDAESGGVAVNEELAATPNVWVAGDMAYFPSQAHGGRRLALRSEDHAYHSGTLAGENMAAAGPAVQEVVTRGARTEGGEGAGGGRRYCHSPAFIGEAPLAGVRMATIGDCSAAMPTHGFWWTNRATGLTRKSTSLGENYALPQTTQKDEYASGVTLRSRKTARREFTPVFGIGVVFYTDGAKVKGAMLWGFPGEAAAAASMALGGFRVDGGGVERAMTPADAAARISARALDVLRDVIERSEGSEAGCSDGRAYQDWLQGLSDAAKVVVRETGVGHLRPMWRFDKGRSTSSGRRDAGEVDQWMYQKRRCL